MNLFDRLRTKRTRSLAEEQPSRPATGVELGASGDFTATYNLEETRTDTVSIAQYRRMIDNDGTVEAIYNMMTAPIKGAEVDFECDKDGDELQFVKDQFTLPPHLGGMTFPLDLLIGDMCRALVEGFRGYEMVWALGSDGKFRLRKLAPRDANTLTLLRDEHGGFNGMRQRTWAGNKYKDVTIEVERCFLYTYAKERSFLYGRSAFKSAYYHYDRLHKLYFLDQKGAESAAIPGKKVSVPNSVFNDDTKRNAVKSAADRFGGFESTVVLPEGTTMEEYKTNPRDLSKSIDHHDIKIARSVLAQFIMNSGSGRGSYALNKTDSQLFIDAIQGVMKDMATHINTYVIPKLIDYNFGTGIYPKMVFKPIDEETKQILSKAFEQILGRPDVPGYVIEGVAEQVSKKLNIDTDKYKNDAPADAAVVTDEPHNNSEAASAHQLADSYGRQLTAAEKRVNLSDISKKVVTAEERMQQAAATFYADLKDSTVTRLRALLKKGDLSALQTFELDSFKGYRKSIEEAMMTQYLYGKRTAADEIGAKIPTTPSKSRQYISTQAKGIADKQASDVLAAVKFEVTKEIRSGNLSENRDLGAADVIARIAAVFTAFLEKNVNPGIGISLAGAFNLGRNDSFGASSDIDRMQYSAILDDRTTRMCKDLDGSVISHEEYLATQWMPPVHWNCRSIWVAILKDDDFKPDYRPLPKSPGGFAAPQLSESDIPSMELSEDDKLVERARRALKVLEDDK